MLILSLESSAKPASAAVYEHSGDDGGGRLLGQYFQNNGFSHSHTLMPMVKSLLDGLSLKPADIGLFAVASGPGSFTGVRIGVSAVKGLAFGANTPVCGVSSLEAMAYQTAAQADGSAAVICPVMDARRRTVYNALFKWENGNLSRLRDDRAISLDDLASDLKTIGAPVVLVGDGADLAARAFSGESDLQLLPPCPLAKHQSAYGVALAAIHCAPIPAAGLEPVYLRPSQAERVRGENG